jgi:hypothetical protein
VREERNVKKSWEMNKICFTCQKVIKDIKEATIEHIVSKSLGRTLD